MTAKDNSGTLPINMYAADSSTVHPLDFTVLSEAAAVPVPHRETTETLYKLSRIVCVKADSNDSSQLFIIACLQENMSAGIKRVEAKVFIQDPFNPVLFTEDGERYIDVSNIVCALTCYNYREDILELKEGNLIFLLNVLHHTIEVASLPQRQLRQLR